MKKLMFHKKKADMKKFGILLMFCAMLVSSVDAFGYIDQPEPAYKQIINDCVQ